MKEKNIAAVMLGKRSAEARKKKMGVSAFNNHMRLIANKPRKLKQQIKSNLFSHQRLHQIKTGYKTVSQKIRGIVLKRDSFTCKVCKKTKRPKNLEIHHLDSDSQNNLLTNLVTVCIRCHKNIEIERYNSGKIDNS